MTTVEQNVPPAAPARVLGVFDATCVVVGAIIGVGIFFTPTSVVRSTGSAELALLAWAIAGGIALCGALTFAALGRRYHASGAQYEVLRDAFGPLPGFVFVFCNATVIQPGAIAIISLVCAEHLAFAASGGELGGLAKVGLAAGLTLGLAGANLVGVRWGARIQNLTVVAKVVVLLAVTAAAAFLAPQAAGGDPGAAPASGSSAVTGVMAALVAAFFSYGGWQHALWISGEVRDPRRTLPRAIVGGVLLVVLVYLLANWAYLRLLGAEGVAASEALAADAAAVVMPGMGARFIAGAVALSAFGVLNAQFLSGPRLLYGMAKDGRFFREFASLHPRFGTPAAAIGLIGGVALLMLGVSIKQDEAIGTLLTGVVAVDSVFFGLTGAAIFLLARGEPRGDRVIRSMGYPVAPALFVLGELGVVAGSFMDPDTRGAAALGGVWMAIATGLYLIRFRTRR